VPVVAVYGANASGKSNLLDALDFMASAVRDSFGRWSPEGGVPRRPFKLDPISAERPSAFVADMVVDGVRHTYGFTVDDQAVLDEWLYSYPEKRRRVLFERERGAVKVGSTVPEMHSKLEVLEQLMRPNALFLSLAAQSNVAQVVPVYRYFCAGLAFRPTGHERADLRRFARMMRSVDSRSRVVELVRLADVGVNDVVVTSEDSAVERLLRPAEYEIAASERAAEQIQFMHAGAVEAFDFDEESDGTKSWVRLLPIVLDALDEGQILVVDEIDTSLHPKLTAQLVRLFQEPGTNPHRAQLVFTTHDTSLLGTMLGDEVLKRDQVWFVEKDEGGASKLYPLTDFRPRKGENTERRYLGGSYGAVPVLSERDFAEAVRARNAS
jgi:ABC-type cobalamin/Fe3+-siderophores transport system ATPase subunit